MDITSTGIEIGPLTFHFYGLLIVMGLLAASFLGSWMAQQDDKDPKHLWDGLIWAVMAGIIGARLWFVFFPPVASVEAGRDTAWMLSNFFDLNDGAIAIWNGGLGIFGGVIGGFFGIWLYARRNKLKDFWGWIDIAAVTVPLGHAVGRWGNFVNQELYGKPTDLPWAISIDNPPLEYIDAEGFHPLFLYESLWNLMLCAALVYLWINYRDRLRKGTFLLLYVVGYSIVRFLLEFLRIEIAEVQGLGINSSQTITALSTVIALGILFSWYWQNNPFKTKQYHPDGRPVGAPKKKKAS